jgi:hypothetical protein
MINENAKALGFLVEADFKRDIGNFVQIQRFFWSKIYILVDNELKIAQ